MKQNNNLPTVETIPGPAPQMAELIQAKIDLLEAAGSEDAFFIGDLGDIVFKFRQWKKLLPRVDPFYAVKCNQDPLVLKLLAELGTGFDCASKLEISQILDLGVDSSRIIYANPCKQSSFLKYAARKGVDLMTFDNESELTKIKALYPQARLVLRILPTTEFKVQCELGNKFGCHPKNVKKLLLKAQELDLNVMGISFHVGSGVEEAEAFACAVKQAHEAFEMAQIIGFEMQLLDIGGGFPGQDSAPVSFKEIANVLNKALLEYFPPESKIRIIAEPGRYFVASAFTIAVNVIAKKAVARDISDKKGPPDGLHNMQALTQNDEPSFMYYVNDGVYGSFNSLIYDHAKVKAQFLKSSTNTFSSSVWGPTCDGLDCIVEECCLPELEVGDWLYFHDMGAYTMAAGSTFNGMPRPQCFYLSCVTVWQEVMTPKRKADDQLISQGATPIKAKYDGPSVFNAVTCGFVDPVHA